jgi:hypothetical protein
LIVVDDAGAVVQGQVSPVVVLTAEQSQVQVTPGAAAVTTLFVSGLPRDTRYREVFNLFRFEPGFEHCSFNGEMGRSPSAWVKFDCIENAQRAMVKFTGFQLDPDGEVLHEMRLELAKKNSLRKQVRSPFDEAMSRFFTTHHNNNGSNNNYNNNGSTANSKKSDNSGATVNGSRVPAATTPRKPRNAEQQVQGQNNNQPGNALSRHVVYLGNLGAQFSDREIHDIVSSLPGFSRVRFARTKQSDTPYAFLEFVDGESAQYAVDRLNGLVTSTSPNAGLRAEIARYGKFRTAPRHSRQNNNSGSSSSPSDRNEFEGQEYLIEDDSE